MALNLIYHTLILTGAVNYRYVWGGRLKSKEFRFKPVAVNEFKASYRNTRILSKCGFLIMVTELKFDISISVYGLGRKPSKSQVGVLNMCILFGILKLRS